MITYYQELLNECIDIQEHNRILKILKQIKEVMKGKQKNEQTSTEKSL